jgi:DNA-directed RNA polymerase subunit RPC12/RpoP
MDIVFKCPHCQTELEVESDAAGETIACPACNKEIRIPAGSGGTPPPPPPTPSRLPTPGTKEEKKFAVPVSNKPVEPLIQKALPSLEAQSKIDGKKLIRLKTIRHSDCKEVGHDNFDAFVTEFLNKIGEENIVSITPINYSYVEMGTQKLITDFGLAIIYRG